MPATGGSYFHCNRPEIPVAARIRTIQHRTMLTRLYVEALLADPEVADQVWEVWAVGMIPDELAAWAWCILAKSGRGSSPE